MTPGVFRVGTSNIVLPITKSSFPEAFQSGSRLSYYASIFNSLEINSSFYKVPMPATFERWSKEVSADFNFTVKLWRNITHAKNLAFSSTDIDLFMNAANQLDQTKKGCLLIQFPASITIDFSKQVAKLLQEITKQNIQSGWQLCIEFRHSSWYNKTVYAMLNRYKASLVLHDMPASALNSLHIKSAVVYLRFHGIKGDYKGSYEPALLQSYAVQIKQWMNAGKDVYAYFNNTIGNAYENARDLYRLVA